VGLVVDRFVAQEGVEWLDLLGHELAHPVELGLILRLGREVPAHDVPLFGGESVPEM